MAMRIVDGRGIESHKVVEVEGGRKPPYRALPAP
jgi:hypothetical protein